MKNSRKFFLALLPIWLFFWPLLLLAYELDYLLDVDRIHYYAENLSAVVEKRGRADIAEVIRKISPQEIAEKNFNSESLRDPKQFDAIIEKLVREKRPDLVFDAKDLQWNYNFFKNKLMESFVVKESKPGSISEGLGNPESSPVEKVSPLAVDEVTLDVDQYVADRTTRGLFWYTSMNELPVELHMGSTREFKDRLADSGGRILAEIRPKARNYNKLYIIQYPNQEKPVYAVIGISGQDRLDHWKKQIGLIRWNSKSSRSPTIKVVGAADPKIYGTETLIRQLEVLPKADHVVIGQKGAIGAAFRIVSRADALLNYVNKVGLENVIGLESEEKRALAKLVSSKNPFSVVGDSNSTWDNLYEKLEKNFSRVGVAPAVNPEAFTVTNDSHTFSDFLFQNAEGKPVRWRVFSNTWGDEITPIAEALKATGHKKISYIGTAGAIPEANLRVGDLFIPDIALDSQGKKIPLSSPFISVNGEVKGGSVAHVGSPFEETQEWLDKYRSKARAVELEVMYLANVFDEEGDQLQANLLISDVVGSKDETLAAATSSKRRGQLSEVLSALFKDSKALDPLDAEAIQRSTYLSAGRPELLAMEAEIKKQTSNRDPVFQYHIRQLAIEREISSDNSIRTILKEQPAFTGADVDKKFQDATTFLRKFLKENPNWNRAEVYLPDEVYSGSWSPKGKRLKLEIDIGKLGSDFDGARIHNFLKAHPEFSKHLEVSLVSQPPRPNQLGIPLAEVSLDRYTLLKEYTRSALQNAGLSFEFGPTDKLNFRWIPLSESSLKKSDREYASNFNWRKRTSETGVERKLKANTCEVFYHSLRVSTSGFGAHP